MKILLVSHKYHPEFGGGASSYCRDVAKMLKSSGHEVAVMAGSPEASSVDTVEGVVVRRIGPIRESHFRTTYRSSAAREMRDFLQGFKPDLIHLNSLSRFGLTPLMLLRREKVAKVMTLHDFPMLCARNNLLDKRGERCGGPGPVKCALCANGKLPRHLVFASAFRELSGDLNIVCPSRFAARMVRSANLGCNVHVLRHFVPLAFKPLLDAGRPSRSGGERDSILFCGRVNKSKGAAVLLALGRGIPEPNLRLEMIGPVDNAGPYLRDLRRLSQSSQVQLHGFLGEQDLLKSFQSARILIFPSVWPEVFGLVILQGFAAGLPVVASRVGAVPEIVHPGKEGYLVEPGDVDGFVERISRCLADRDLLARMSIRAFEEARRYSSEAYLRSLVSVYEEACQQG